MTKDRKSGLKESKNYEFFVDGDESDVAAIETRFKAWIIGRLIVTRTKRVFRNLKNAFRVK